MTDTNFQRMAEWLEQAWLARYLDRELSSEEIAWFEAYLLDKSDLIHLVEADEDLRGTVQAAAETILAGEADLPAQVRPMAMPSTPLWLAWAASLALCVGLTWFTLRDVGESGTAIPAAPSRVIYDTMRGSLTDPREEPGDPASPIRLYEVPLPAGTRLDTAYADVGGTRVALPNPPVSADGYITFALPSSWRYNATLHLKLKDNHRSAADLVLAL